MNIATSWSTANDMHSAAQQAFKDLETRLGGSPDMILLHNSVLYDSTRMIEILKALAPNAKISGGTSCLGVMTETGFHSDDGYGLGLMGISDPDGSYGVGAEATADSPREAASTAVQRALADADRSGELPSLVLLIAAPGNEEKVIQGVEDVLGPDIPIIGGSSGDNTVEGHWKQFANEEVFSDAVVATTLFPSARVAYAFHSGYMPTTHRGRVTKAVGRSLYEIENQPAALVYNEWTEGAISSVLESGGNVLGLTTLNPIGRVVGEVGGLPYFRLSHPDQVASDGAMTLFSDIEEGDELILMSGTRASLLSRAGRVAQAAIDTESFAPSDIYGAFVIYCAGCMLTVQHDMDQVVTGIRKVLGNKPFLGAFTFGEQGCFVGGENRHGNLMISTVVFGR